jgi:hypothetical protein
MLVAPAIAAATIIASVAIAARHSRRVGEFAATTMVDPDTRCRPAPTPTLHTIRTGVLAHQPHIAANRYLTKLVTSVLGFAAEARIVPPTISMAKTIAIASAITSAITTLIGGDSSRGQRSKQTEQRCSERARASGHACSTGETVKLAGHVVLLAGR